MFKSTKRNLDRETTRATDALEQTRQDRKKAEMLVALREEIAQRVDNVLRAAARP